MVLLSRQLAMQDICLQTFSDKNSSLVSQSDGWESLHILAIITSTKKGGNVFTFVVC